MFLETYGTCHIFGFIGKNKDRKIKANTCDKKGGITSGRCQVALALSFMKKQGHLKQPDAHAMLFLDFRTDLEGSLTFTESPPPLPATPGAYFKGPHLDTENLLTV